jgi:opacity protein-like surface antigen
MKKCAVIFLFLSLVLNTSTSHAQGKLGVFVGVGTMFYSGDLQEFLWPHPLTMRWTANAGLHWQINRRWGLQLNYTVGEITGNDKLGSSNWQQRRNLNFRSLVHEIGLRGTFDILPNDRWKVLPYITAGVAALNFEPKSSGVALRSMQNEGVAYSNWSLSIPTGAGAKWQINCRWALKGELVYHWTITDYLDDVSARGNPKFKDGFWDLNVGVIYFFVGCGSSKKGGLIEDCEQLYKDVDLKELQEQYK